MYRSKHASSLLRVHSVLREKHPSNKDTRKLRVQVLSNVKANYMVLCGHKWVSLTHFRVEVVVRASSWENNYQAKTQRNCGNQLCKTEGEDESWVWSIPVRVQKEVKCALSFLRQGPALESRVVSNSQSSCLSLLYCKIAEMHPPTMPRLWSPFSSYFIFVYVYLCECMTYVWRPGEGVGCPGCGVTEGCKLQGMGDRNQIWSSERAPNSLNSRLSNSTKYFFKGRWAYSRILKNWVPAHELTTVVTAHTRPAQDQATQHSGMDGVEAHEAPSLAKKLLAANDYRGW